jgi:hypothetical protein
MAAMRLYLHVISMLLCRMWLQHYCIQSIHAQVNTLFYYYLRHYIRFVTSAKNIVKFSRMIDVISSTSMCQDADRHRYI